MLKSEKAQIEIDVKTQNAVREISRLQQGWNDLIPQVDAARKEVDKASKALEKFTKSDRIPSNKKWKEAYDTYYNQLGLYKKLKTEAENYTIQIERQVKALGLAGLTNRELDRYYKEQKRSLDGLRRGTEEYAAAAKKLQEINVEKATRGADTKVPANSLFDKLKSNFVPALIGGISGGLIASSGEIVDSAISVTTDLIKSKAEVERSYGVLAAELGLDLKKNAEDIQFYKQAVKEMGIEFGMVGPEILEIIRNVGSLKPELLGNREALKAVTQDVIILSKASNGLLSMEESAQAVTGALNQFGEEADQSTRFINVMAAGAKEGSSKIQQTAEAFQNSGAVLKASGLSFEESNALVQILAQKMIVGSEAGTNLRNIFSKLLTGSKDLNPAIHGMSTVLDRLASKSPAEMMKLFGQESVVAAMELVKGRKKVDDLTNAITGTTEAFQQYEKVNNNLAGDLDALSASSSRFWETLQGQSSGWIRSMTQGLTSVINQFSDLVKYSKLFGGEGYVQKAVDEKRQREEAQRRKMQTDAKEDIRLSTLAILPVQKGKDVNQRTQNANKKITDQVRDQFLEADKAFKELVRSKASADQIQEAQTERTRLAMKLKYAKQEGQRLQKVAQENSSLINQIKEGDARAEEEKKKKTKDNSGQEKLKNEAKLQAEINQMKVNAITDEHLRKEAQIKLDFERDKSSNEELLKSKKLSQSDYENWLSYRKEELDRELKKNDDETNKKATEEAEKVYQRAAKRRLDLEEESLRAKLEMAQANEQKEAALSYELQLLEVEKELELLSATEEEKLGILERFRIKEKALNDKYLLAQSKEEAEKTKKDAETAKKKDEEALNRKKELYQKIGQFISMVKDLTDGLFSVEKQNLENQQTQEDNRYNKKLTNLQKQKDQGIISEEEYQAKSTQFEQEHDTKSREIKRKMWEADKKARIASIIMSTAQAVVQSLPNIPLSILAGVIGAIQLANALSVEAPQYAEGDFLGSSRKTHSVFSKPTPSAQLFWGAEEGPEFVSNNKAVNSPDFPFMLPILRKMNKGLPVFPDLKKVVASFSAPQYALGDFIGAATVTRNKEAATNQSPTTIKYDERYLVAIEEFNKHCRNGTWAKVMFTHKNADDFNDLLIENQEARSRASIQ